MLTNLTTKTIDGIYSDAMEAVKRNATVTIEYKQTVDGIPAYKKRFKIKSMGDVDSMRNELMNDYNLQQKRIRQLFAEE